MKEARGGVAHSVSRSLYCLACCIAMTSRMIAGSFPIVRYSALYSVPSLSSAHLTPYSSALQALSCPHRPSFIVPSSLPRSFPLIITGHCVHCARPFWCSLRLLKFTTKNSLVTASVFWDVSFGYFFPESNGQQEFLQSSDHEESAPAASCRRRCIHCSDACGLCTHPNKSFYR